MNLNFVNTKKLQVQVSTRDGSRVVTGKW